MKTFQSDYHSYLLRLWRVKEDGEDWRALLVDVMTGEEHGFKDLSALFHYLEELDAARQDQTAPAGQEPAEGRG